MLNKIKELNNMTNELRERKRYLKLIAILYANGQELTKEGEAFAINSLEERTPLEAAVDINFSQNNSWSNAPKLFVEL
tara:strand:+ start:190 stop:423 length:234 start_codon:yes stop_codon:yes gene_type:complete